MAAIDGPAGPSMATKSAIDGPAGPVVAGDHLRRDRSRVEDTLLLNPHSNRVPCNKSIECRVIEARVSSTPRVRRYV